MYSAKVAKYGNFFFIVEFNLFKDNNKCYHVDIFSGFSGSPSARNRADKVFKKKSQLLL